MKKHKVAIADDHGLFRKGIVELINGFVGFEVSAEASDGKALVDLFEKDVPDIALLDINMKGWDGFQTAKFLKQNYPELKVLALSMYDQETMIIKMIKAGAKGYILKDADPDELEKALNDIVNRGFYYSDNVGQILLNQLQVEEKHHLNERELQFIELACSELTYKEIADIMNLSPRSIDGYRENLFSRLDIKNRVGLVLYALKNGIVSL